MRADGTLLPLAALTAIHWTHRVGALVAALMIGSLALILWQRQPWRRWAVLLLALLTIQVSLGILNVILSLPLALAVAHNLGAAMLLAAMMSLTLRLFHSAQ
jgi:cytochrome c oxidase assembly protein subunit 15